MPAPSAPPPLRLFLDTGALIQGHFAPYSSAHAVLILCTLRRQFQALIADPVAEEFTRWLDGKAAGLPAEEASPLLAGVDGWLQRSRPLRPPWPTAQDLATHDGLLAVVRHKNDMPAVIAAVLSRPDWVLSTNTELWNQDLTERTGLRVAHPARFLALLRP